MIFEYIFVLGGDIATWCQILGGNVTGEFTKGGNVNADSKNWEVIWRLMGENKKAAYGRTYDNVPKRQEEGFMTGTTSLQTSGFVHRWQPSEISEMRSFLLGAFVKIDIDQSIIHFWFLDIFPWFEKEWQCSTFKTRTLSWDF